MCIRDSALAWGLAAMARDCATVRSIDTMVCSGGVLHNRLLAARLTFYLADFTLLFAQQLPAGDGAIAYGCLLYTSSAAAAAGKPVAVGSITASGFAGRCFRARSVATAAGLPASQAR